MYCGRYRQYHVDTQQYARGGGGPTRETESEAREKMSWKVEHPSVGRGPVLLVLNTNNKQQWAWKPQR